MWRWNVFEITLGLLRWDFKQHFPVRTSKTHDSVTMCHVYFYPKTPSSARVPDRKATGAHHCCSNPGRKKGEKQSPWITHEDSSSINRGPSTPMTFPSKTHGCKRSKPKSCHKWITGHMHTTKIDLEEKQLSGVAWGKTWYWSLESGFAWNPPLLRGARRYGNGAAMKTIRKNQNLSETRHMFSGTGTDAGNLQLEPWHCELQPNTPTGWQFMRHTKMILPPCPQSKELPGRCSTFPDPMAVDLEAESCQRIGMTTNNEKHPFYQRLLEKTFSV